MAISDKTRKILWGRSGNRCALCRKELVLDATSASDESVVGEECHIVSGKDQGPRYDPTFPPERLDEPENLTLLCRNHHKMVDDQRKTYTVERLQSLKATHESWVSSTLNEDKLPQPVRVRGIKENIPDFLVRLTSGIDILKIVDGAMGYSFENDDLQSEAEVELVGQFLQEVQDWGDLSPDLEAADRVKTSFRITGLLRELEQAGFWVFGERENKRIEGGVGPPSAFPIAILRVVRSTNDEVIKIGPPEKASEQTQPTEALGPDKK